VAGAHLIKISFMHLANGRVILSLNRSSPFTLSQECNLTKVHALEHSANVLFPVLLAPHKATAFPFSDDIEILSFFTLCDYNIFRLDHFQFNVRNHLFDHPQVFLKNTVILQRLSEEEGNN
jgi:hypothetical protein